MSNSAGSSEVKSKQTMEMQRCFRGTTPLMEQKDDVDSIGKRSHADADSTPDQMVEVVQDDSNCRKYVVNGGRSVLNSKRGARTHTLEATVLHLEEYINKVKWLKKNLHYGFHPPENQEHHWKFVEPHDVQK